MCPPKWERSSLDVGEQAAAGDGLQGGLEQDGVASVRAVDDPADRDPEQVSRDRPLPPDLGSVRGVQDSRHGVKVLAGSKVGFCLRPQDEIDAGVTGWAAVRCSHSLPPACATRDEGRWVVITFTIFASGPY